MSRVTSKRGTALVNARGELGNDAGLISANWSTHFSLLDEARSDPATILQEYDLFRLQQTLPRSLQPKYFSAFNPIITYCSKSSSPNIIDGRIYIFILLE